MGLGGAQERRYCLNAAMRTLAADAVSVLFYAARWVQLCAFQPNILSKVSHKICLSSLELWTVGGVVLWTDMAAIIIEDFLHVRSDFCCFICMLLAVLRPRILKNARVPWGGPGCASCRHSPGDVHCEHCGCMYRLCGAQAGTKELYICRDHNSVCMVYIKFEY